MEETKSFYSWSCVTYMSEESIKRFATEQCRNWAYALHDKDVTEEGNPKEKHFHIVVTFEQRKSFNTVKRLMALYAEGQNSMIQPTRDIALSLEYLTHKNDLGKFQYDREVVKYSSKAWYEKYIKGEEENETENDRFVDDLLAPTSSFSVVSMARKYGRDFMRNMKSYMEFRRVAIAEMKQQFDVDKYTGEVSHKVDEHYDLKEFENEIFH